MICIPYRVETSAIPLAGKGLWTTAPVKAGTVLIAPTQIESTIRLAGLLAEPDHPHAHSSIRWFEDHCTLSPDWPDECFVNHSFSPTAQWHLGFIFARQDLQADEEITVDYRYLIGPGVQMPFTDSVTGQPIVGLSWGENLLDSTRQLLDLALKVHVNEIRASKNT